MKLQVYIDFFRMHDSMSGELLVVSLDGMEVDGEFFLNEPLGVCAVCSITMHIYSYLICTI